MATTTSRRDYIHFLLSELHRELTAVQSAKSNVDMPLRLKLQEVIKVSQSLLPSTSSSPPLQQQSPLGVTVQNRSIAFSENLPGLNSEKTSKPDQELNDRKYCEKHVHNTMEDPERRIHGLKVAREISRIPEHEWRELGDNFERPFGEGCSRITGDSNSTFRLYFKGLVSEEWVSGQKKIFAGIGIAIFDPSDDLVLEVSKPIPLFGIGMSKNAAEAKALVEGLSSALTLKIKRVVIICDCHTLYKFITARWTPKQPKIATLVNQVSILQEEFVYCNITLVARYDIKYAFKLARDAIVSQFMRPSDSTSSKAHIETCIICLEETEVQNVFSVDGCHHRYCFSCMKQHVEVKLLHGMVPKCPHEGCKSELNVDSCKKFLTSKLVDTMKQRIKEASIPATEKIYCPHPKCSALMSKAEICAENAILGFGRSGARKCLKCHGLFCIDCKVPWHSNMTCDDYKRLNPNPPVEDEKLKFLASRNLWRQCVKCNHMIELSEGCYHMTCRCGFEFCYNCGVEWKNKKATCSCPLWDEDHIWNEYNTDFEEEDEEEDDILEFGYDFYGRPPYGYFDSDSDEYIF